MSVFCEKRGFEDVGNKCISSLSYLQSAASLGDRAADREGLRPYRATITSNYCFQTTQTVERRRNRETKLLVITRKTPRKG